MPNLSELGEFDVIIVLGAAQYSDGRPGPAMVRRMASAIGLRQQGSAPLLLLSGGVTSTPTPEAETMRQMALAQGVSENNIICETTSRTTLENAVYCAEIVKERGLGRCLLVTDDFHMPRAMATFLAFRVSVTPYPVEVPLTISNSLSIFRELVARIVYPQRVRAYLKDNSNTFSRLGIYDEFEK